MSQQAAQQATSRSAAYAPAQRRGSSKLPMIGVGIAGALLTAAAIGSVALMSGSTSAPVGTQVAAVSAPAAIAPAPVAAPDYVAPVAAPVAPAPVIAPVAAPAPVQAFAGLVPTPQTAPALNVPDQCQVGQRQLLSIDLSATKKGQYGNVLRVYAGSYVSPPIVLTRNAQTVTFPAPSGSNGVAHIIIEQKTTGGWTFEESSNGVTMETEYFPDDHHDAMLLRWPTGC